MPQDTAAQCIPLVICELCNYEPLEADVRNSRVIVRSDTVRAGLAATNTSPSASLTQYRHGLLAELNRGILLQSSPPPSLPLPPRIALRS